MRTLIIIAWMLGVTMPMLAQGAVEKAYREQVIAWRKERERDLKKVDGWLAVAGLFWLKEGDNTIGTAPTDTVVLPPKSTISHAGIVTLHDGKTTLRLNRGVPATNAGKPILSLEMKSEKQGTPDKVIIAGFTLTVIERGTRTGIRLYDNNSQYRKEFVGLKWYPVNPVYKITAHFVPYSPAKRVTITNVLGDISEEPSPGYATFTLNGVQVRLDAIATKEGLFFNFRDATSGNTTYGAGRFLETPKPVEGRVILDFNRAYSPPCAFTPFATCPLPPSQNHLPMAIPAGEKNYTAKHP